MGRTDLEKQLENLFKQKLEIENFQMMDIKSMQYIGKNQAGESRIVFVEFNNRQMRNEIFKRKMKLSKMEGDRIYINEDLLPVNALILRKCRKLVREKTIARAWTFGGKVYIKEDVEDAPLLVSTEDDLNKYIKEMNNDSKKENGNEKDFQ